MVACSLTLRPVISKFFQHTRLPRSRRTRKQFSRVGDDDIALKKLQNSYPGTITVATASAGKVIPFGSSPGASNLANYDMDIEEALAEPHTRSAIMVQTELNVSSRSRH